MSMSLAKGKVNQITRQVYKQFPEMKGAEPKITPQNTPARANGSGKKQQKTISQENASRYLLTFNGKAELPNGHTIHRVVRVISDGRGKIIKITTSR